MRYRTATLLAAEDQTAGAGTKTIDINVQDIISRIMIRWVITKSVSYMMSYPHKDITKIELVDGSEVLYSLDGGQSQALCIYDRKVPTMNHGQYIGANSQRSFYGIDFGRFLFDPVLALDPKRFKNLQLKITYDEDVSDTGNTANTLEVKAECFDERVVTPMGFLSAKMFESWSISAASAYHYVDLPTDRVIRKLLIQGYLAGYEPWYQIAEARLDEDNEKRIPLDWNLEEYHQYRKGIDPEVIEHIVTQIEVTDRYYYLTPTDYWAGVILQMSDPNGFSGVNYVGRGGKFTINSANGTEANGIAHGWLPNHCFQFPFGDQQDIEDWYDVSRIGSLRLRLKSGSGTSGNGDVILQQLRKY